MPPITKIVIAMVIDIFFHVRVKLYSLSCRLIIPKGFKKYAVKMFLPIRTPAIIPGGFLIGAIITRSFLMWSIEECTTIGFVPVFYIAFQPRLECLCFRIELLRTETPTVVITCVIAEIRLCFTDTYCDSYAVPRVFCFSFTLIYHHLCHIITHPEFHDVLMELVRSSTPSFACLGFFRIESKPEC